MFKDKDFEFEWPRFEDGEPVRIGDATEDARMVCRVSFTKRGFYFNSSHRKGLKKYRHGEAVKRPARADSIELVVEGAREIAQELRDGREGFTPEKVADALDSIAERLEKLYTI